MTVGQLRMFCQSDAGYLNNIGLTDLDQILYTGICDPQAGESSAGTLSFLKSTHATLQKKKTKKNILLVEFMGVVCKVT